jgi:predicted Rossmann fold nucleotide-binding protein DprA/Smf involved in DNA uptake
MAGQIVRAAGRGDLDRRTTKRRQTARGADRRRAMSARSSSSSVRRPGASDALVAGLAAPDDLVAATDLPIATVLAALTVLEGRGLVTSAYGRYRPAGALAAAAPGGRRAARRSSRADSSAR